MEVLAVQAASDLHKAKGKALVKALKVELADINTDNNSSLKLLTFILKQL